MATVYYPSGTAPYTGSYYAGLGSSRTLYSGKQIVDSSKLWKNGSSGESTYARARLKVDYTINGMKANITVTLQYGRTNGDYGGSATVKAYFDGSLEKEVSGVYISKGCAQRNDADIGVIPESYFTTICSKTYTGLEANSSGVFSKTITVEGKQGSSFTNYILAKKTVTISFSGGWTSITAGKTEIKDNGDNSFTITAIQGTNGTNNAVIGLKNLKWGYDKNYSNSYTNGQRLTLTAVNHTDVKRRVYAQSTTDATYGSDVVAFAELDIKRYTIPYSPKNFSLLYNKSRLTVKENWTLSWESGGSDIPSTSPITGYVIRIYKNGQIIKGLQAVSNSNEITLNKSGMNESLHRLTTATSFTINPENFGFKAGDTFKVSLAASTKWGNGQYYYSATVETDTWTVQNAGTVRVKVNNSWQEGQVWVKVNNAWQEADVVKVKVPSGWEESE